MVLTIKVYKGKFEGMEWYVPSKSNTMLKWAVSFVPNHRRYFDVLKHGDTVIEAGATTGEYTIPAAIRIYPGKIYAFEPQTECFNCLLENAKMYGMDNIVMFKVGFSNYIGTNILYKDGGISGDTMVYTKIKDWDAVEKETVNVTTIDNFVETYHIERVNMLKITVNGYDPVILSGAKKTLEITDRVLIQSFPKEAAESWVFLSKCGFVHRDGIVYSNPDTKELVGAVFCMERPSK